MTAARVKCPTCDRTIEWSSDNPYRPFCSERCKLIDLGAWLSEKRGIPAEEAPREDPSARETRDPDSPRQRS
ncbi:MAG: DNA gyrase inhibitor YacG [Steroidobacteraceae bacterium]